MLVLLVPERKQFPSSKQLTTKKAYSKKQKLNIKGQGNKEGPHLDFQSEGAINIVSTEAQPCFARTGKLLNFDPLICLKMTLFETEFETK